MSPIGSLLAAVSVAWAEPPADPDELPDAPSEVDAPEAKATAPATAPVLARAYVEPRVGAAIPLGRMGPSLAPGVEAGVLVGSRVQIVAGFAYSGGRSSGTAQDPALESYTWTLSLHSLALEAGARVRILPWSERLSPEVALGPSVAFTDAAVGGAAGGAAFPETRESGVAPGGFVSAGLVGKVGPGTLCGSLTFRALWLGGELTGDTVLPTLTPAIGYRLSR